MDIIIVGSIVGILIALLVLELIRTACGLLATVLCDRADRREDWHAVARWHRRARRWLGK